MRYLLLTICLFISTGAMAQKDTLSIYFPLGMGKLTPEARHSIDSLLYNDILAPKRKVGIIGYADNVGDEKSNMSLSLQRAKAVQAYLVSMQIDTQYIEIVTGKGEINREEKDGGYPQDRRVDIVPGGIKHSPTADKNTIGKKVSDTGKAELVDFSKTEVNGTLRLEKILFVRGTDVLLEESYPTLQALYKVLKDSVRMIVQIEGHVCCGFDFIKQKRPATFTDLQTGKKTKEDNSPDNPLLQDVKNMEDLGSELSFKRAYKVYAYLISRGIDKERLKYKGFGASKPFIYPETNEEDRAKNRRVEIRVLAK
ncbi:MAG: OmpA family protein [Bacteroidetes bacterium]|nr:OmpA family protein [Bacteroidota bacterium]